MNCLQILVFIKERNIGRKHLWMHRQYSLTVYNTARRATQFPLSEQKNNILLRPTEPEPVLDGVHEAVERISVCSACANLVWSDLGCGRMESQKGSFGQRTISAGRGIHLRSHMKLAGAAFYLSCYFMLAGREPA